jgi:hypothetical protein
MQSPTSTPTPHVANPGNLVPPPDAPTPQPTIHSTPPPLPWPPCHQA